MPTLARVYQAVQVVQQRAHAFWVISGGLTIRFRGKRVESQKNLEKMAAT
jgi:hypothetical protein